MRFQSIAAGGSLPADADDRLRQFLAYWRVKGAPDRPARRRDIDPLEIVRLLPAVVLLDVEADDFRFSLVGQDIVDRYGTLKGQRLRDLMTGRELHDTLAEHRLCVTTRLPVFSRNTERSAGAGDWRLYERLLTPLAGEDGAVASLAGVMVFREYRS